MKIRRDETLTVCPRCGEESPVTKGASLVMCALCLMRAADAVDEQAKARQRDYDWPRTLLAIRRALGWKQRELAYRLRLHPDALTAIKKGRRHMPKEALRVIHEEFSKHVFMRLI